LLRLSKQFLEEKKVQGAYELLKELTRTNDGITESSIAAFVEQLEVSEDVKQEIRNVSPFNYLGYASE
jgi:adenylosuccinate lyase